MRASRRGWLDNRVRNNATKIYVDCIVSSREVEREISRFVSTMIKNRRERRFRVFSLDEGKERTCSKARTCLYLSFGGYNSTWWSGKCDEKKYYFYKSHPLSFPGGREKPFGDRIPSPLLSIFPQLYSTNSTAVALYGV